MKVTIELSFDTDDAAFTDDPEAEFHDWIGRVQAEALRLVTHSDLYALDLLGDDGNLRDSNGNTVGTWTVEVER